MADESRYPFRRQDNDEIVMLSFVEMMEQDAAGFVTLEDGTLAQRCRHVREVRKKIHDAKPERPIVSDALGFAQHQLAEFEEDRKRNGFTGVEFKRDPRVPEFIQAHFSSQAEWRRYVEHRGMVDKNSLNGSSAALTPELLERARRKTRSRFPVTVRD